MRILIRKKALMPALSKELRRVMSGLTSQPKDQNKNGHNKKIVRKNSKTFLKK